MEAKSYGTVNNSYVKEDGDFALTERGAAVPQDSSKEDPPKTASDAFDRILKSVGGYGPWQWKLCFICGFCGLFTSLHNLGAIFLAASPVHWCKIPSLNLNESASEELKNLSLPWEVNKDGVLDHSKCSYNDLDYDKYSDLEALQELQDIHQGNNHSFPTKKCHSWHYDTSVYQSTLVSEWDLVCDRRWLMSVTQASYMFGILMGAVVTSVASDKIGRRKATLACTIIFFLSSVSAAFSTSFEMFLTLRFFTAAAGQGMYLVNFVLLMEAVEQKGRSSMPTLFGIFFGIGSCFLPLIAYLFRQWRHQQLATGIPTVILLIYFWILPESPRWLLMQGRFEEGFKILEGIAKRNGGKMPPCDTLRFYTEVISKEGFKIKKRSSWKKIEELIENLVTLVRTRNMRRRNLVIFYAWFVVSSVFYGLAFSGYNINVSIYILMFSMSFVGVLITPIMIFCLYRFGRRITLAVAMFVCGLSCLIILVIPNEYVWINMTLVVIGRNMTSLGFNCVFIYSSELVPTNIRNLSMGIASMWGRIGSIISPFIVDILGEIYYAIPSTLFGVMALLSGGLCFLLPETGFSPLPESVQEIESQPR